MYSDPCDPWLVISDLYLILSLVLCCDIHRSTLISIMYPACMITVHDPCPPLRIPTKKKQSRHTHVDQVIIMIISVVVVYEQGVGLKSSITVDTASRKDLTLQGCTNCPLQASARTPCSLSRAR